MGQKYAAFDKKTKSILGFYDSTDSPPPQGKDYLAISDEEWQKCLSNPGYTVSEGVLIEPVQPTADDIAEEKLARTLASNLFKQSTLKNDAINAMTPLLLSLQLDNATVEDIANAKAWQSYYRELKLVDLSVESPSWPGRPNN